eukprot:12043411-Prorocentrum_lima.AAC.1
MAPTAATIFLHELVADGDIQFTSGDDPPSDLAHIDLEEMQSDLTAFAPGSRMAFVDVASSDDDGDNPTLPATAAGAVAL